MKSENICVILTTGGLVDSLNQVYAGLKACEKERKSPVIAMELSWHYKTRFSDLLSLNETNIVDYSEYEDFSKASKTETLQAALADQNFPTNTLSKISDYWVYKGKGGGLIAASKLLKKSKLSPHLVCLLQQKKLDASTDLPAFHLRCGDVSPENEWLDRFKGKFSNALVAIYSDCDPAEYLGTISFVRGDHKSKLDARDSSDILSLFTMAEHKRLRPIPLSASGKHVGFHYSGFGLLALVLYLKRRKVFPLFTPWDHKTLWEILRRDPKNFVAVIFCWIFV